MGRSLKMNKRKRKKVAYAHLYQYMLCLTKTGTSKKIIKYNRYQHRICTLLVQLYSYVTSVNCFMCPTKLPIIVIIKCWSYCEISAILCFFIFCFTLFCWILEKCELMWENFVFLVIFDTCDVMYNWSISLLPSW